ncbi:protein phosphatase 1F-like [Acanthaster planci]|uniref:Protein phosphatase 1E n=1 Tax=Acanthaster planci TaxID=133434 RepID=A0A8B7ZDK5_ACAPL|nr:protein phosphatase 1F-like [Acanthaster planci]
MGSDPRLDVANFKKFLQEFSSTHAGTDNLPFSSLTCHMTKEEIEGECLEWVTNCLVGQNKAPYVLAAAIARATVDIVLSKDLTIFVVDDEGRYGDDDDITCTLYDAGQIFPLVWTTVNDLCERWKTDLPDLRLPPRLHQVSLYAVKNTRKRMEDRHVIVPDLNALFNLKNDKERSFYAVYDGHGGTDAAMYACQHLHGNAIRQDCFLDDPSKALAKSFQITDEGFLKKARREGLGSGTTGVAVIIESDTLHISWLGDSQVYLMREGQPVTLMEPHKPERPDERSRIEQLGGCVLFFGVWRVNGTLAVSRAIGDPDQKPYISSDADMTTMPLTGNEDCIIIACDGLWDVVEPKVVCRIIQESINGASDMDSVAHRLVVEAKTSGSNDNITVLVVFLNPTQREIKDEEEEVEMDGAADPEQVDEKEEEGRDEDEKKGDGDEHQDSMDSESGSQDPQSGSPDPQSGSPDPQLGGGDSTHGTSPAEPSDSETNTDNDNRSRRGSDLTTRRRAGSQPTSNLAIGSSVSPRQGEGKRLEARRRSGSDDSAYLSGSSPLGSPYSITPKAKSSTPKKSISINRHQSFPSSTKRLGKNTCRIRKARSVKTTNKTNAAISDLVTPTSSLEISSQVQQRENNAKRTAPAVSHKSMPVTIKPKSVQGAKSMPRQSEMVGMLKNKPKFTSKSRFSNLDP